MPHSFKPASDLSTSQLADLAMGGLTARNSGAGTWTMECLTDEMRVRGDNW